MENSVDPDLFCFFRSQLIWIFTFFSLRYSLEVNFKLFACCVVIFHDFLLFADFFQNQFFLKICLEYLQSVKQFRPDQAGPLSGLILVQTVCKGHN